MVPPSFWDKKDPIGGSSNNGNGGSGSGSSSGGTQPSTPSSSSIASKFTAKKDLGSSLKKPLSLTASTPRASLNLGSVATGGSAAGFNTNSVKSRPSSRQTSRPGSRFGTLKREEVKGSGGAQQQQQQQLSSTAEKPVVAARPVTLAGFTDAFLESCRVGEANEAEVKLGELRKSVLFQSMPDEAKSTKGASLRGKLWKVMLALDKVSSDEYIKLIEKKESLKYAKIRGDSFRTFKGCEPFLRVVTEVEIIRLLNSFVNRYDPYFTYCQGMNTICGPFLYVMPEPDAFFAFSKLVTKKFPLYWVCSHIGVQAGAILVDQCIKVVDKPLADHLEKHNLSAYIYAFHCISSLCASIPPFGELLKLWDFLLSFGAHLNILCVVAQVIMLRERILESQSPKSILDPRKWPALRARAIISVAMAILPSIPNDLYQKICAHASDPNVAGEVANRTCDNYIPLPKDDEEEPTEI